MQTNASSGQSPSSDGIDQGEPNLAAEKAISLIQSLQVELSQMPHRNGERLDALRRRTKMILAKAFGPSVPYLKDLAEIHFYPTIRYGGMPSSRDDEWWRSASDSWANVLATALEELEIKRATNNLHVQPSTHAIDTKDSKKNINQVFVVHGHDVAMKAAVARVLERLGLKPIILHEQADKGRTIIEKFIDHSSVGFAVVLFSPDDLAYEKGSSSDSARPRARQNVVLELGFFLGKLGRERVLVLHKQVPNFDMPSDYAGVLFKPFDEAQAWRLELARELAANGFKVDANRLL